MKLNPPLTTREKFAIVFIVGSAGMGLLALVAGVCTLSSLATGAGLWSVSLSILFLAATLDRDDEATHDHR